MFESFKKLLGRNNAGFPTEAIVPIKTHLGINPLVLHINGEVEGDFRSIERYLKTVQVTACAEDRIIFWLLLQYWRQHQQMDQQIEDMVEIRQTANNSAVSASEFIVPSRAEVDDPVVEEFDYDSKEPIANSIPVIKKIPISNNNVVGNAKRKAIISTCIKL